MGVSPNQRDLRGGHGAGGIRDGDRRRHLDPNLSTASVDRAHPLRPGTEFRSGGDQWGPGGTRTDGNPAADPRSRWRGRPAPRNQRQRHCTGPADRPDQSLDSRSGSHCLQPFHTLAGDLDIGRLDYEFVFRTSGKQTFTAVHSVTPATYRQQARLRIPLAGRILVWDGPCVCTDRFPIG